MTPNSKPTKVLIVEDVDSMRHLLGHLFQGMRGISVSSLAKSVAEGRIELTKHRPDLVLLDEILPGESSLDFLEELKTAMIPVILLTGLENPQHDLPAGTLGRIVKPGWESLEKDHDRIEAAIEKALKSLGEAVKPGP